MSKTDKFTVLSFDETHVSKRICYDKAYEQIIGPNKCVQTVMARGEAVVKYLNKLQYE